MQAPGVGAMGEDGRVGGGGDHRAEVHEGAQEAGRGAHAGGVGLPVEGVLVGEAVADPLRDAHDDPDGAEQPDRAAGVRAQQRGTPGDLHQTAHDDELARIASRRPVTAETASALSDRGSSTSPVLAADRSRPSSSHCVKPYRNAYAVVKLRN